MEVNGIVLSPDPRLRQECKPIEEITPEIEALAERMKREMFENAGVGLAAPQIGELVQMVVIDTDYESADDYDPIVLINPVIVEQSEHLVPFSEGCLSIPGVSCEIKRPDRVVVEAYDLDANLMRYEAEGGLVESYIHMGGKVGVLLKATTKSTTCTASPCSSDSSLPSACMPCASTRRHCAAEPSPAKLSK